MISADRIFDTDLIKAVITRDDMWATVAEDGQNKGDYLADVINECWIMITDDDELVGLYNLHVHNSITIEIHAHILPEHRKKYSKDSGRAALEWIYLNSPEYKKVIAQIPVIYENVKKFTCSFGFKEEGINRMSYLKNSVIVDQWMLGITREEIEGYLK